LKLNESLWLLKSRDGKSKIIDLDKIVMLAKTFVSTVSFEYVPSNIPLFCLTSLFFVNKDLEVLKVAGSVSQRYANSISSFAF
jgi:hypothetical protein